jgi:hypothetical protein
MTMAPTRAQLEHKLAQAYQVIGTLLGDKFETDEGQRLLDYFSREEFRDDFLPWPKDPEEMRQTQQGSEKIN